MCTYTGKETKIMMNSQKGRIKMSHLEAQINKLVFFICGLEAVLCTIMAIITSTWFANETWDNKFISFDYSDTIMSAVSFFTYFLLLNTFLPISL